MSWYALIASIHAALGTVALATFWTAGLARKGSPVHRAAGKLYLLAMVALLVPAVPMTLQRLATPGQRNGGVFLAYLLLIVATSVWLSWRAIRDKRDFARYTGPVFRALAWANVAGGAAMLGFGAWRGSLIFVAFALVGLLGGRSMLRMAKRGPAHPRWWLEEHLGAMIGNGVATHIAFLLIGLPRLLPGVQGELLMQVAWLAPLALAVAARWWLGRKYLPAPAPRQAANAPA